MKQPKSKYIIITSIAKPTQAVKKYAGLDDWQVIVVGDKKTPKNWQHKKIIYLSPEKQTKLSYQIVKLLPWNHYCRKMVGYLFAIEKGAEVIYDTDDDNIPKKDWAIPQFWGKFLVTPPQIGFINVYRFFTQQKIWPRGYPLDLINEKWEEVKLTPRKIKIGIWQGLADNDPDVDAIYRLVDNRPCNFNSNPPMVLNRGAICPGNSQNTAFRKELFSLLYLPAFVNFRFTDILRGLIAQPIMWSAGYRLGFSKPTVTQQRNIHDYFKDFESELPMYVNSKKVADITTLSVKNNRSIVQNLTNTYKHLYNNRIVEKQELSLLTAWLKDLQSLTSDKL